MGQGQGPDWGAAPQSGHPQHSQYGTWPGNQYGQQGPGQHGPGQQPAGPHGGPHPARPGGAPGGRQAPGRPVPPAAGEPEYFGSAAAHPAAGPDPYDDNPGHTRPFTLSDAPDQYGAYPPGDGYAQGPGRGQDQVTTYRAGQAAAPPAGPRLPWKELIKGIFLSPAATFWRMRDHQVWGPALTVTFLYGLFAVFGFDTAREDVLSATLSNSIPWVLSTAVAVVVSGLMLGAVTNALARQFGGDGVWAPTIGLAMLITSLTDAPRLLFAMFLGGGNSFVQVLGWATWIGCAALLTSMVSKSHDLPWQKALGAASVQLIALLVLFKLPVF